MQTQTALQKIPQQTPKPLILGLGVAKTLLTPNTAKYLTKNLIEDQDRKAEIMGGLNPEGGSIKNRQHEASANDYAVQQLDKRIISTTKLLNRQLYIPKEQSQYVSIGSGVKLLLNGKQRELFVDSTCVGKCKEMISLHSPLGEAIYGGQLGDEGVYEVEGAKFSYRILEILPYTKAKEILKKTKVVKKTAMASSN